MTSMDAQTTPHDWLKTAIVMIMTMRENDAARWDPEQLVDFARSFSVDALGFSVGGITAFYPTEVPLHPRSPSLGDRDLVGDTLSVLRRHGLKAIARIDSSLTSKAVVSEHPDWGAVDRNGAPISVHGLYVACPNGGYYRDFTLKVIAEILDRYPFDGLWANAAQFSPWHTGVCHCANCRRRFHEATGEQLPAENWADPLWRRYNELRYRWVADWNELVHAKVHEHRPDCAWLPLSQVVESWDHARRGGWDVDYTEPHEDALVLEAQRRYTNLWWPGVEARYIRSMAPEKAGCVTVSYFLPWWRFHAVPAAENQVWTAQIVAHGARPWLHVTGYYSEHFDRRGLEPMRNTLELVAGNRDAYEGLTSQADVAIVYSRYSQDNLDGSDPEAAYIDHFRGAYNAMMHERIAFDVLTDKRLTASMLARYKTVLLPNAACLDDKAVEALRSYVENGGHLVASFESGFREMLGEPRKQSFVLDMLDLEYTGTVKRDMRAAYARVLDGDDPLLAGMGDTDVLPIAGDLLFLSGPQTTADTLAYVPPVEGELGSGISVPEFNAIEHVSAYSLVVRKKVGAGSVVYFPWQPEMVAYRYGLPDLFRLIGNAVRQAPDWEARVEVSGPGLIDIAYMGSDDRLAVTLINFSAPGTFNTGQRRIAAQILPLHDLKVRIRLPEGRRCASARLTVQDCSVPFTERDGALSLELARLESFETILLRLD